MNKNFKPLLLSLILVAGLFVAGCSAKSNNESLTPGSSVPASSRESSVSESTPEPSGEESSVAESEAAPATEQEILDQIYALHTQEELDEILAEYPLIQFEEPAAGTPIATMHTSMGDIRIALYPEHAPKAVENFITHAQEGYYDGIAFHRVIEDFMIQGGDPMETGGGGESIYKDETGAPTAFEDEFSPSLLNYRGALSMANSGANTNGSQFFIVQAKTSTYPVEALYQYGYPPQHIEKYLQYGGTPHLDFVHTVFGFVMEGMDVVDAIAAVPTDANAKPETRVFIKSITIENAE